MSKKTSTLKNTKSRDVLHRRDSLRKSTAFLKEQGFGEVYHLKAAFKYLEEVPLQKPYGSECFVFDGRVTVNLQLEKGNYDQCNACRLPITEADKASDKYQQGVSCPHCYGKVTDAQKTRFMEREKQVALARQRVKLISVRMPTRRLLPNAKPSYNDNKKLFQE